MVVKPEQLADEITASEEQALLKAEAVLDDALQVSAQDNTLVNVTASVNLGNGLTRRVAEKLAQKYRQAGWSAEIVNDQREGNYLRIFYQAPKSYQWDDR